LAGLRRRGRDLNSIPNPKLEIRNKSQIRTTEYSKQHISVHAGPCLVWSFEFRYWNLFRISCFGFRICFLALESPRCFPLPLSTRSGNCSTSGNCRSGRSPATWASAAARSMPSPAGSGRTTRPDARGNSVPRQVPSSAAPDAAAWSACLPPLSSARHARAGLAGSLIVPRLGDAAMKRSARLAAQAAA
jgi:hypothetical protein